ncbi:hypothetical protein GCM10023189_51000 [Nibrella saemangeumensis]|uniref:Lipocalin-like domain-containing protein n=1 Tax=Nibrella saemangeumensis TaxID=1084526 RepID=A0ABP8NKM5_9BACT
MNLFINARRSVMLVLLAAVSFTACKKEVEPDPDMASQIAGSYTYTEAKIGGKTYPASQTNIKGSVKVIRETANTVSLDLNIRAKSDNSDFLVGSVDGIELTDAGSGTIGLRVESDEIAQVKGDKIIIKSTDDTGAQFTITAEKN